MTPLLIIRRNDPNRLLAGSYGLIRRNFNVAVHVLDGTDLELDGRSTHDGQEGSE